MAISDQGSGLLWRGLKLFLQVDLGCKIIIWICVAVHCHQVWILANGPHLTFVFWFSHLLKFCHTFVLVKVYLFAFKTWQNWSITIGHLWSLSLVNRGATQLIHSFRNGVVFIVLSLLWLVQNHLSLKVEFNFIAFVLVWHIIFHLDLVLNGILPF